MDYIINGYTVFDQNAAPRSVTYRLLSCNPLFLMITGRLSSHNSHLSLNKQTHRARQKQGSHLLSVTVFYCHRIIFKYNNKHIRQQYHTQGSFELVETDISIEYSIGVFCVQFNLFTKCWKYIFYLKKTSILLFFSSILKATERQNWVHFNICLFMAIMLLRHSSTLTNIT